MRRRIGIALVTFVHIPNGEEVSVWLPASDRRVNLFRAFLYFASHTEWLTFRIGTGDIFLHILHGVTQGPAMLVGREPAEGLRSESSVNRVHAAVAPSSSPERDYACPRLRDLLVGRVGRGRPSRLHRPLMADRSIRLRPDQPSVASRQTALTSLIGLEAGIELLGMVNGRRRAPDSESVAWWTADFNAWHSRWEAFLEEHTIGDGRRTYTHERLRRARAPHEDPERADAVRAHRGAEGAWRVLAVDQ